MNSADDDEPADDTQPPEDEREKRLILLIAAALRKQSDLLAARIAGTEHTPTTAAEELNAAQDASFFDLDPLFHAVRDALEARAVEAAHEALLALPPEASPALPKPNEPSPGAIALPLPPEAPIGTPESDIATLLNKDAVEYANKRAAEMIGRKLVDGKLVDNPDAKWAITDTTRDGIRKLVQQAEENGHSVQQLANAIRESALFSPARAKRIAQWELAQSDNNGNLIA